MRDHWTSTMITMGLLLQNSIMPCLRGISHSNRAKSSTFRRHTYITYYIYIQDYISAYGGFLTWGYPKIIHFNRIFHYEPAFVGYPHFRTPPCNCVECWTLNLWDDFGDWGWGVICVASGQFIFCQGIILFICGKLYEKVRETNEHVNIWPETEMGMSENELSPQCWLSKFMRVTPKSAGIWRFIPLKYATS